MPDADVDERITMFANYIVETFVDASAMFPPALWASFPDNSGDDVPRTTNAAEAFHAQIKQSFRSARPNLYLLAFKLLERQEQTYVDLQSLDRKSVV